MDGTDLGIGKNVMDITLEPLPNTWKGPLQPPPHLSITVKEGEESGSVHVIDISEFSIFAGTDSNGIRNRKLLGQDTKITLIYALVISTS